MRRTAALESWRRSAKRPRPGPPRRWVAARGSRSSRRRLLGGRRDGRASGRRAGYHRDLDVLALQLRFDLADAVANGRGALEIEGFRGRPHLVLEQRQLLTQVVERELALPRVQLRWRALGLGFGLASYDVVYTLAHGLGRDAVQCVVGELLVAPALRLGDGRGHGVGHLVGVEIYLAVHVPGRTADRLDQRTLAPEEAGLVCVEDRHQADLREVEALAQEVDAHEYVEVTQPQVAD